jgi:hypothetical protein
VPITIFDSETIPRDRQLNLKRPWLPRAGYFLRITPATTDLSPLAPERNKNNDASQRCELSPTAIRTLNSAPAQNEVQAQRAWLTSSAVAGTNTTLLNQVVPKCTPVQ